MFAVEFRNAKSNSRLKEAAFFMPTRKSDSIGCCSSGSRFLKPLLDFANLKRATVFFYLTNIFNPIMRSLIKNANKVNNSNHVSRLTTVSGTTKSEITLALTGVRNPYLYALRKSFYEFLVEETRGHLFSDLRLKNKIEAARLLFPEARMNLRCKTVKI